MLAEEQSCSRARAVPGVVGTGGLCPCPQPCHLSWAQLPCRDPAGAGSVAADPAAGQMLCSLSPLAGCCWLTRCSLTVHSSQVHLLLCSSHPNAIDLFLLGFAWFPELGQSGQFQLVSGPKDIFPFAFAIWRCQGKAAAHTDLMWVPGICTC